MALYNQLAFALLSLEILTFIVLIIPLPFTWRRAMFKAMAESVIVAKIQYGLKISFIFISLLFVDAVRAMLKVEKEGQLARETGARADLRGENDFRSRKFLAQRNFYLMGTTLFLSLILSRTYSLVLDLIKAQEDLAVLQTKVKNSGGASAGPEKAQLVALQKEYDDLSKKYVAISGSSATTGDKKKDV